MTLIAATAVAIRLALVIAYSPVQTNDSASYLDLAHRLGSLHLHGSPGARTPGYPLVLLLLGYSPTATWYVQAAIGVLATLLLYRLIRSLGGAPGVALAAALAYSVDLEVLAVEHFVLTETLAGFLILVASLLAVRVIERPRDRAAVPWILGLTLACLCLVRPDSLALTIYLAAGVGIAAVARGADGRRSVGRMAAYGASVVLPALVVLAAWAGVNRATIGVTTVSTVLGHNMLDHVAPFVRQEPGANFAITSAYVAARQRRQEHSSDLANLSFDAAPAMERVSHLNAAHLSGRLLSIALGVIAHHPVQYVASSVKQWPRFFLPPNYPDSFRAGTGSSLIHAVWKPERALRLLVSITFVLLCLAHLGQAVRRRPGPLNPPAVLLAGAVAVGVLVATFLAYGETGRYGYVYYPLVLAVTCASAPPLVATVRARRAWPRGRASTSSA